MNEPAINLHYRPLQGAAIAICRKNLLGIREFRVGGISESLMGCDGDEGL
jgi:hypothetical protein